MSKLAELRARIAEIDAKASSISRQIDTVPDTLPWAAFSRRLNNLEARGTSLHEERRRLVEQVELYEDILNEVRKELTQCTTR